MDLINILIGQTNKLATQPATMRIDTALLRQADRVGLTNPIRICQTQKNQFNANEISQR